ncbi:hypothetical protein KAF25_007829 [Fusarium avenaceum]|uniref:WSC domain-containing protein n=1 Tax=Fusarium avenaceum TaxID=40199 RepID=A0A9P7KSV2_9HYPO|nr:hypothetical protein KAF25_007829 [Fusarium avenaceum]
MFTYQLFASAVLLPASQAFSIVTTNDANTLAAAIFGQGTTVLGATFSGASVSSGTFADGPFGIGSGAILTSGAATGALPNGDHYVNNGAPGSDDFCGPNTFNAAILTVDFLVDAALDGVRVELIVASEEEGGSADPIGIFLDGTQYAFDPDGNRITAVTPYLGQPLVITPPNSVTSYPGSTPPFWIDILGSGAHTMVIAICDQSDAEWDSELLIKAEGCDDCDSKVRLAYVTITTTLAAGEAPFTSTTTASGTVSGTIRIGVLAEETTTTTAEQTTNTAEETTTTTAKNTTTTTTQEPSTATTSNEPTTTTAQSTTTDGTTETSTVTSSEELPDTTTTTLATSDTTTEYSLTTTDSMPDTTTAAQDSSTESTTGQETTSTSNTLADGSTTSSGNIETPSISSSVSISTDKLPESLSSDISTLDTTVSILSTTMIVKSLETTTVQQTESTDIVTPSSTGSAEVTSSADATTLTAEDMTSTASIIATASVMPPNLAVIGTFGFRGCLGSLDGYPSFELIGETPEMTTEECVKLGTGRAYVGIYLRSCYAADALDSADLVPNGRCDLPCPGDPGLFCGGIIGTGSNLGSRFKSRRRLSRRDAPPNILLTLYANINAASTSLATSDVPSTVDATTDNSLIPTFNPTITVYPSSSTQYLINSAIPIEPSVSITESQGGRPIVPPFPTSAPLNAGNFTRTEVIAPIFTTITYTAVDPNNPSSLTVTEFCTTLRPPPCRQCQYQKPPTVEMTTIKVDCNSCGHYSENTIILEVPAGAVMAAPTRGHSAHEPHQVPYHEPEPEPKPDGQKPRPHEGFPHTGQTPRPQNAPPTADDKSYDVDKGYKFDQPQAHEARPTGTGDNHEEGEPAAVPKTEPEPKTVGGDDKPEPPNPTLQRRPGPGSASRHRALSTPVVVVSGAIARAWEGVSITVFLTTGLVFLL